MALITEHLAKLVEIISQDEDLAQSGKFSPKHKPRQRIELGVSANYGFINHPFVAGINDYEKGYSLGAGFVPQINFGFNAFLKPLKFGYTFRIPLTDFAKSAGVYNGNLRNSVLYFTLTYTF